MVFEASALIPFLDVSRNLGWGLRSSSGSPSPRCGRGSPAGPASWDWTGCSRAGRPRSPGASGAWWASATPLSDPGGLPVRRTARRPRRDAPGEVRRQIVDAVRSHGRDRLLRHPRPGRGLAVADRVALLSRGEVVQVGRPRSFTPGPSTSSGRVHRHPADRPAAGPPGGLRRDGRLPGGHADPAVVAGGARSAPGLRRRDVVLGLRAEDVSPATGTTRTRWRWTARSPTSSTPGAERGHGGRRTARAGDSAVGSGERDAARVLPAAGRRPSRRRRAGRGRRRPRPRLRRRHRRGALAPRRRRRVLGRAQHRPGELVVAQLRSHRAQRPRRRPGRGRGPELDPAAGRAAVLPPDADLAREERSAVRRRS